MSSMNSLNKTESYIYSFLAIYQCDQCSQRIPNISETLISLIHKIFLIHHAGISIIQMQL